MIASRCCRSLLIASLLDASAAAAEASSRTQLTGLLQAQVAGEASEAPQPDSRRSGRESAVRLATALVEQGSLPRVQASALLSLELPLDALHEGAPRPHDLGSYVGVAWRGDGATVGLRTFPFDTDYLRVGQLRALTWGGTDTARGESIFVDQVGGAPGVELSLEFPSAHLFAASKWSSQSERERLWGWLFGGTFWPRPWLRLDAGFGYFQRAEAAPGLPRSFVEGASVRLVLCRHVAEPELSAEPFRPPSLRSEREGFESPARAGMALALEGTVFAQRVRRAGDAARFELVPATGAALYGSVRGEFVALHAAATWRSPELLLVGSHGLIAGEGLWPGSAQPELAGWIGVSAELAALRLTPSLQLGLRLPAALRLPSALPGFDQSLLVGEGASVTPLPLGAERRLVASLRAGVRFEASRSVSLALFLDYERDSNRAGLRPTPAGPARTFVDPDGVTLSAASWARF